MSVTIQSVIIMSDNVNFAFVVNNVFSLTFSTAIRAIWNFLPAQYLPSFHVNNIEQINLKFPLRYTLLRVSL